MSASVRKQSSGMNPEKVTKRGQRFNMDFGFMRASTDDYTRPDKSKDWVAQSFDGYNSYLLIVDEISRYVWVFLTESKELPIDLVQAFLAQFGNASGGLIRTYQGGELACSSAF